MKMHTISLRDAAPKVWAKKSAGKFAQRGAQILVSALAFALAAAPTASAQEDNTNVGHNTLKNNTTGSQNSAFGNAALEANTSGSDNTAIGAGALISNQNGGSNVGVGYQALGANVDGANNTAIGTNALLSNDHGANNTAGGVGALQANMHGSFNTAYGENALFSSASNDNTGLGAEALSNNDSGYYNTAVGKAALNGNIRGAGNTAVGGGALLGDKQGNYNTAIGADTLYFNTGSFEVSDGWQALYNSQYGNNDTAIGARALYNYAFGGDNVAIGYQAGVNLASGEGNVYIASPGPDTNAAEQDTIRIGNATNNTAEIQRSAFIAGVRGTKTGQTDAVEVLIDSKGQLGTISSSLRFKEDIRDMAAYSRRLFDLRPVTFRYKEPFADGAKPIEPGLIAEEVADVYPDLVARGADGRIDAVQYFKLTPMLLNELQNQRRELAAETAKLDSEAGRNAALAAEVRDLEASLAEARRSQDALAERLAKLESTARASGAQ
jgi:hypothetical protein